MKPPGATTDATMVREFVHIITAQAKAALAAIDKPGLLQLSRLHPTSENLVSSRFQVDDDERMIEAATTDSEAGHNVYVEGRTVRADLRGNIRGSLAGTVAVFGLVVDSDADTGKAWAPTIPVSMTVETSPGNFQYWFFLREAISAERAQKLGERIRAATRADHDSGNPTQPYRVGGTINFPSKTKVARGRVTVPTRIVEFDPEALWTPEQIEQAFPLSEREIDSSTASTATDAGDADEAGIPADTVRVIREGLPANVSNKDRSHAFWNVLLVLKQNGWSIDGIVALLDRYPNGIAAKYIGRLHQEVERVYAKIKDKPQEPNAQPIGETFCAEALKTMTFAPIKYVVPGIFIEGLTLFAGKPKTGKSWLLLHAALAVARGGFTLGDVHCTEGDVLYCALEDSKRRLKSRITKLIGAAQDWPRRLFLRCEMPRLSLGGLAVIRDWIEAHPQARLIVIDTLAMVRAPKGREESTYDSDYAAVLELRKLANETGVAIVVVHHLRKADADDAFDTVSGTLGLTGAPDTVLVLKRDAGGPYILHGRGRDLVEIEKAMEFDLNSCLWRIAGDAVEIWRSNERQAVLEAIKDAEEPVGPNTIAAMTGMRAVNVRKLLGKLVKEGVIEKAARGRYQPPGAKSEPATPTEPPKPAQARKQGGKRKKTRAARPKSDTSTIIEPPGQETFDETR